MVGGCLDRHHEKLFPSVEYGEKLRDAPEELKSVLVEHKDLFIEKPIQNITQAARHHIRLASNQIIRQGPYKYPPERRKIVQEEVEKTLKIRVIRPSHSAYQ